MKVKGDKKLIGAYILDMLKKSTNKEGYSKTIEDMIETIKNDYGVDVDKRTIQRYIATLLKCGYNIKSETLDSDYHAKAYYYEEEQSERFSDSEVEYIIDSLIFSKHVNKKVARGIINKFKEFYSSPLVESLSYVKSYNADKIELKNEDYFLYIEMLHEAIRNKKRVRFKFCEYNDLSGNAKPHIDIETKEEKNYNIVPLSTVVSNDMYFLIGYNEEAKGDKTYVMRIDYIRDLELMDSFRGNKKTMDAFKKFDLDKFVDEHPIMSYGEIIDIKFDYEIERIIDVFDTFGLSVKRTSTNDKKYARISVRTTEWTMRQWLGGHLAHIKNVKSSKPAFDRLLNNLIKTYNQYK